MRKITSLLRLLAKVYKEGITRHNSIYETGAIFNRNARYVPGEPYSAIVSVEEVKKREEQIWEPVKKASVAGIDLNEKKQLSLLEEFQQFYKEIPFDPHKKVGLRYYFDNNWYTYSDGIILYSVMRYYLPKKIIEIGSGFSSALMLDMKELYNDKLDLTFIEPDPERLYSLLKDNDKTQNRLIISEL